MANSDESHRSAGGGPGPIRGGFSQPDPNAWLNKLRQDQESREYARRQEEELERKMEELRREQGGENTIQ